MKRILLTTTVAIGATLSAYSQGTVNFANAAVGLNSPITHGVTGVRVAGAAYLAQLYYANGATTDEGALEAAAGNPVAFSAVAGQEGYFFGSTRVLDRISPAGGSGTFQVRAWAAVLGNSWETAFAAWQAGPADNARVTGRSGLFTVDTANPTTNPQETPVALKGLTSFTLNPVPEPSTIALGILGGMGALVLFRRRK
jgi:hypothetical protein